MILLPNNAAAAIAPPQTAPILLLELTFTSPSSRTLYLCSRPFGTGNTYAGHVYDPLILDWSPVAFGQIDPVSLETQPGDTSVRILNTEPVGGYDTFSGFLDAFDWAYASATLSQVHEDALADGDAVTLFSGAVEMPEALSRESVTIRISGRELSLKDKWPVTLVNATDYPGADPDDIGAMIPQVWGACKRVPARAVAAGGKTTITQDMTDSSPGDGGTLAVTDGSLLPSGAFTLQVEMEQISIASRSGNTLTLASSGARGYNGTTAVDHDTGAHCAEVKTHYVYMVADHPVKSIDAVYVDDVRQAITSGSDSNCRVYTGQSGDEMTGYPGKAVIDFQALPYVKKQVNVEINNTLGIDHTDGISDGITVSDNIDVSASQATRIWQFETYTINGGNPLHPEHMYDGDLDNAYCAFNSTSDDVDLSKAFYEEMDGAPQQIRLCACCGGGSKPGNFTLTGGYLVLRFDGHILLLYSSDAGSIKKSSWFSTSTSWGAMNSRVMEVFTSGCSAVDADIMQVWVEIRYTPSISKSGSAYRSGSLSGTGTASLTGDVTGGGNSTADVVIGRAVCADVRGYQDDSSGTYTGAANALIERPDHVFHHMLKAVLGETHIDIEDGLIGFWPMDEGAGTTVHDGRGTNHGTINGTAAWEDGQVGKCLHFDGSSGHVDFGDVSAFNFTTNDNFAFSFRVYMDDTPTDLEVFLNKFHYGTGAKVGWEIRTQTDRRIHFITADSNGDYDTYSTAISPGSWYHVIVNYSAGTATIYIDNVDQTASHATHHIDSAAGVSLVFGCYSWTKENPFDGKLDEVRFYNKNLSGAERAALHDLPRGSTYSRAGARFAQNGYNLAVCLAEKPEFNRFFNRLAFQCRCCQFFEAGTHRLVFRDTDPDIDRTLSGHRIDLGSVRLEYTLRAHLRNNMTGLYDRHWDDPGVTGLRAEVTAANSASVTKYGTISKDYILDYLPDSACAQDLLDWLASVLSEPRLLISLTGDPSFLDIERGDTVAFDVNNEYLSDALLGKVSASDAFIVLAKRLMPDFRHELYVLQI